MHGRYVCHVNTYVRMQINLLVDLEAHIPLGLRRQLDLHHRRRHLARLRGVESVTAVSLAH